jgi:hypothetical protein
MPDVWKMVGPFFPVVEPGRRRANRFMASERERLTGKITQATRAGQKRWSSDADAYPEVEVEVEVERERSKASCSNLSSNEALVESHFPPEETATPEPTPPSVGRSSKATPKAKATAKPSHEAEKLAALLAGEVRRNAPDFRITPGKQRSWTKTADRMLRLDHRSYDDVADMIRWVQADEFWHSNVLSMDKLREKFDQLLLKAEPRQRRRPSGGIASRPPAPAAESDPLLECRVCRKRPATYMGPSFGDLCVEHMGRVPALPAPGGAA